jgi:predicted dehydrogenase
VVAIGAVGLGLPRKIYYEKELTFLNSRSYGPGRYDPVYEEKGMDYPLGYVRWTEGRNLQAVVDLMASNRLEARALISHRFPIEQALQAYELITGKQAEPFLGVLLTYPAVGQPSIADVQAQAESPKAAGQAEVHRSESTSRQVAEVALGVLGAGNFASAVMLPALRQVNGVRLVGIASASGASAQHAANRFGFAYAAADETQINQDAQINTIAILTRHHQHARQVLAALQAGKHVFCEKPLALNEAELAQIEAQLDAAGQSQDEAGAGAPLLMVGFNRRFAPLAQKLKEFLAGRQEALAAHYRVNAGYLPPTHWTQDPAQGGGRVIGEACHFIDFLTFLVGSPPVAVSAQGLPDGGRYCEDNVVMTFTFADGSLGTLSYLANGDKSLPKERLEVFCGGRVAVLDDYRSLETILDGKRQVIQQRLRQDKGHQAEWQAFVHALQSGGPPPIPYGHLFGVTRATFAALRSLRSGNTNTIN